MGIITSRRTWSNPSFVGSNFSGISLDSSLYVAGGLASSCADEVPASAASARMNAREQVPTANRPLSGFIDVTLRASMGTLTRASRDDHAAGLRREQSGCDAGPAILGRDRGRSARRRPRAIRSQLLPETE